MTRPERPRLRALADRLGILPSYLDIAGVERVTADATREALLRAMGYEAADESAAAETLLELERRERERLLDPVRVVRSDGQRSRHVRVRLPEGASGPVDWRLELVEEGGTTRVAEGRIPNRFRRPSAFLPLPGDARDGYHTLRLTVTDAAGPRDAEQSLILVPGSCPAPGEVTGGRSVFGTTVNLYTVRSARNWGAGDVADLASLVRWSSAAGAAFIGLNPLHALWNRGWGISPYRPVSRLFLNPLYIDLEAAPELAQSPEARRVIESAEFRAELDRVRAADHVDYEGVMRLKRSALEPLHRTFAARHRGRDTGRGAAYARFLERKGVELADYATFLALDEHFRRLDAEADGGWRRWPAAYRDPRSPEVAAFRDAHAEEVDLHRYVQFELERQLAAAGDDARTAGLRVGVYQDLALGTAPDGSDPWAFPGLFVEGASAGAPPDDFSRLGQNWGLPPIDPHRLAEDGYRYWIRLLRAAFAAAGALRIDHVMGLFRLYWIPAGHPGTEGAYVRYPSNDLIGILALESRRRGALVVGEDLGTVPPGLRSALARRNILSSRVLYFERKPEGFRSSSRYPRRALVTANTHDLPPLAGFWEGRDLVLRREVGHIETDQELERARAERERDRQALRRRLVSERCLRARSGASEALPYAELCAAVTAFLSRTPCWLAALSLDDLTGETDPVNLPGVGAERYPSWSRRMRVALEDLAGHPVALRALEETRSRASGREPGGGRPAANQESPPPGADRAR